MPWALQDLSIATRRCRLGGSALLVVALYGVTPALAQVRQCSFSLNEGGPGTEYLSVATKIGLEGNSAYTIEAWVYPTAYTNFPTILGNDYHTSYWLGLNTTGQVRFYPRGAPSGIVETPQTVPLNRWTHVAAVYDAAVGTSIYLDGTLAISGGSITGAVGTSPGDLRIGADREGGSPDYLWRGYLDDVRVWSVARTGPQIRDLMVLGVGRPASFGSGFYAGLEASWANEFPNVSQSQDFGGGVANHAAFVNGDYLTHTTFTVPFGPPVAPNVALALNGVDDRVVLPVTEDFGGGVTVTAWIAPTDVSGYPTIVGRDFTTSFWLGVTPTGTLRFYPRGGEAVDGTTAIQVGDRWTHVAATYDGARTVLYVNGEVDRIATDVSGPIGANGRDVWVGADNGASGLDYPFPGFLDEVIVAQGVLSRTGIRRLMHHAVAEAQPVFFLIDQEGESVVSYHVSFDVRQDFYSIPGSGSRLVRGGTPAIPTSAGASIYEIQNYAWNFGGGSTLPDDDLAVSVSSTIEWPLSAPIGDVRVFVSAPLTDLALTKVRLRSPSGTLVTLLNSSAAVGRDLLTVIADVATPTWATGFSPYYNGVRPSDPLSALNGEPAQGTWRLELSTAGAGGVGLWAWALQVNGVRVDAGPAAPARIALRLAGSNPVRGTGALALELPEAAVVELELVDIQGRKVQPMLTGHHPAGSYRVSVPTERLTPGVYFARLRVAGAERASLKLSVVR